MSVRSQHAELPADGCGTSPALDGGFRIPVIEKLLNIAIPEAVDQVFSVVDGGEQFFVVAPGA
jgi:hypothetical protein